MQIFQLESFPIEQTHDLDALEEGLGRWVMDHPWPMRLLAYSRPFDIAPALDALTSTRQQDAPAMEIVEALLPGLESLAEGRRPPAALAAAVAGLSEEAAAVLAAICSAALPRIIDAPAQASAAEWRTLAKVLARLVWAQPLLDDLGSFYREMAARQLRSASYYLITWEPAEAQAREIASSLAYATGRRVTPVERIPAPFAEALVPNEARARLEPVRLGAPYAAVLRSFAMPATYGATILHPLMDIDGDVTIAVDITTLPPGRAQFEAESQLSAATTALRLNTTTVDPATEQRAADAERVMRETTNHQALHQVQVAALVTGEDERALARAVAAARDRMGGMCRMEAVAGSQAELLRLFSTTPTARIGAAWRREDILSKGVGCLLGIIGYHRASATDGWMWGTDAFRSSPVFIDPFSGDRAGHMVFLGVTGFGKTFAMNVTTLRAAALAGHRVIWVDADRNAARVARAVGGGARLNTLGLTRTINPLDLVFSPGDGDDDEGGDARGWLALQVNHVIAQLSLILGEPGVSGGAEARRVMLPRALTGNERGYLERALADIYERLEPPLAVEGMPTLDDLIDALEAIAAEEEAAGEHENEARALAVGMRLKLYGSRTHRSRLNATGRAFCGHTTVDWAMGDDVVCFDLTPLKDAEEWKPLFYAQFIGAFYRYMRDPRRDLGRKTMLMFDEFGLACQVESVLDLTMTIAKVARKYGVALCVADQLPAAFLANPKARAILDNARIKVIFHLGELPSREVGDAFPQLAPEHVAFIGRPAQGECVIVMDQLAVPVVIEPTARELELLAGS